MAELTKESSIQELAKALGGRGTGLVRLALWSDYPERFVGDRRGAANTEMLAQRGIHNLGGLLTPDGEKAIWSLGRTGPKSILAFQTFLNEKGFDTDWPIADAYRNIEGETASRIRVGRGKGLSLERAVEEADKQYAAKTGKPVGEFSKKLKENIEAQEKGARLKGRRTL